MIKRLARLLAKPKQPANQVSYPSVQLTYWRPNGNYNNFGDDLSKVVVSLMLAARGMTLLDEAQTDRQLLAIGSVLHFAKDGATVWGSGINGKIGEHRYGFTSLDVRAVRGPLTAEALRQRGTMCPDVFGDPALLLPKLCGARFLNKPRQGTIFVPNLNDQLAGVDYKAPEGVRVVSPMQSWNRCVAEITSAELVLSTSLHGIVVAEAYGIPARMVRLSEHENTFKYRDYYLGTGRDNVRWATSVVEAQEMQGEHPPRIDLAKLAAAFPFDLWLAAERTAAA